MNAESTVQPNNKKNENTSTYTSTYTSNSNNINIKLNNIKMILFNVIFLVLSCYY